MQRAISKSLTTFNFIFKFLDYEFHTRPRTRIPSSPFSHSPNQYVGYLRYFIQALIKDDMKS